MLMFFENFLSLGQVQSELENFDQGFLINSSFQFQSFPFCKVSSFWPSYRKSSNSFLENLNPIPL
jgi:hypothetical protein